MDEDPRICSFPFLLLRSLKRSYPISVFISFHVLVVFVPAA